MLRFGGGAGTGAARAAIRGLGCRPVSHAGVLPLGVDDREPVYPPAGGRAGVVDPFRTPGTSAPGFAGGGARWRAHPDARAGDPVLAAVCVLAVEEVSSPPPGASRRGRLPGGAAGLHCAVERPQLAAAQPPDVAGIFTRLCALSGISSHVHGGGSARDHA